MKKYLYVPVKKTKGLNLGEFPNAGPNANITGMRNKFWGKDSWIIKSGVYIYKVDPDTFIKARHNLLYE